VLKLYCIGDREWMEEWVWNTVKWYWKGKITVLRENQFQYHFVHHKSHINRPKAEPGPPMWEAHDLLPKPWHGLIYYRCKSFILYKPWNSIRTKCALTLLRHNICIRFLWIMRIMPGGWTHASPSTWTGTPSSPKRGMNLMTCKVEPL